MPALMETAPAAPAVVTVENLSFRYAPDRPDVIANMSMAIAAGQVTCLVGPSGCGKTTLLNLIAGLLQPGAGTVCKAHDAPGQTGYLFQQDALLPWRTVRGNLGLAAELRGRLARLDDGCIDRHLRAFNLDIGILARYPDELSGGMRQRVAIVQSLMADPVLLLLDEPFGALDVYTRLHLETEFRSLILARAMSAIFVTHDIEEAIAIGDRVLVMGSDCRGVVEDVAIRFGSDRPPPDVVRGKRQFGDYHTRLWRCLRDAI